MSASQTQIEPIDWTDLPDDHRLGFGWKKRKENLEDVSQALKAADVEGFEKEDLDWEEQLDSVIGMNPEDYESREEAIQAVQEELEEEREAIDQTKEFIDEAAEIAEQQVKDIRQELGVEEAREQGWYSAEEAIQIDGFHYVHAQSWFPILEKTGEVDFEDDLQTISERALEVDHAADAYQIDREIYEEITSELKKPLQNFIAVGKLGEDNKYRQKVEKELKESLTDWITSEEEAEEYIEKLDKNLDWRTTERYVDLDELDKEHVNELANEFENDTNIELPEDGNKEEIVKYGLAQKLSRSEIEEEFSEDLIVKLREMQENLQSKSRGRLIDSLYSPEITKFEDVISESYRVRKGLWLASHWNNEGKPMRRDDKLRTHANISRVGQNILSQFSKSRNMMSKNFLKSLDEIGVDVPEPRYWKIDLQPIFKPDFPLNAYQQGMLNSTMTQGKTAVLGEDNRKNPKLEYNFSDRENSVIRKKALKNIFCGENGIGSYDLNFIEDEPDFDSKILSKDYSEGELNNSFIVTLPACLGFLREVTDNAEYLEDEDFAEGYLKQAFWERGYNTPKGVQFEPRDYENFKQALETLEINYHETDSVANDGKQIGISNSEIREHEFLENFYEVYELATN